MEITLYATTGNFRNLQEMKGLARNAARVCYSEKDVEDISQEEFNSNLTDFLIERGHHSPFEHAHLTFYFKGIPKILAMVLNNERQYVSSEKSGRYTEMKGVNTEQNFLYEKWGEKLIPLIDKEYPQKGEQREKKLTNLARENARYMLSVFTPTRMLHTINLRQLNFLIYEFEDYIKRNSESQNPFERKLSQSMRDFLEKIKDFKVDGLRNMTDRHLSLFNFQNEEDIFRDVYSVRYFLSFAGLAQAQRHRTISYNILTPEQGAPFGFFVPPIVRKYGLEDEWLNDLERVAREDFPQAQLVYVRERGNIEDFRSKCILRLCGHAQYEIMENTKQIAEKYTEHRKEVREWIKPKCLQGFYCKEPCAFGGKRALERIV